MIPFSVLDLSPIVQGATAADAFRNSLDLAQHAERWQYKRYWLAEHHNMPGIASAATAVVIGHVANGTKTIRVGSGGVMLPNHAPLVIAEQFGTLASLYPDRIDLGLGRAPGTDMKTARALRRNLASSADNFPNDVSELQRYFSAEEAEVENQYLEDGRQVRAVPGSGLNVPIWLLGSSLYSAQLAAEMGLPFAFAAHFAPAALMQALDMYRSQFRPSEHLQKPYAMVTTNVFAADTTTEARKLFTSLIQQFINLRRGTPTKLLPPVDDVNSILDAGERVGIEHTLNYSIVGDKASVKEGLQRIIEETEADEIMVAAQIFDHTARLRSFEIVAELHEELHQELDKTSA
ncbi:hypothetical protein A7981_02855 [Methylovorus sp. MM2]|uniref:LLM class flavin-dependent oxidoreductase n=1 Tax=Methylovorus sp. MM2 TaxID=1848038 RepID=UPI0007E13AFD|nr:LLM class flavin-dependent oxidoreductase [Methylovorus sp. MM2]OAM52437.1 hypothetical protein A7981_02855 [Methylovorus sp. MM2]